MTIPSRRYRDIPAGAVQMSNANHDSDDVLKWSGSIWPIPPVGTVVTIPCHNWVRGTVVSYFTQYTFVGVTVLVEDDVPWDAPVDSGLRHSDFFDVFGTEIVSELQEAPAGG